jgi:hypothetical protein
MTTPTPRWSLVGTSTNDHGVTFFTLVCRDATEDDVDYHELMSVLKRQFGAVETGQLSGPYSVHKYVSANGISFAIILDSPDWLDLYARDQRDVPALERLVTQLLEALNCEGRDGMNRACSFRW